MTPTTITQQQQQQEEEEEKKAPTPNDDRKIKKKKKPQSIDSVDPSIISNTNNNKKRKRQSGFDSSFLDDASLNQQQQQQQQQQEKEQHNNNNNNNNKINKIKNKNKKRKKVSFSEDVEFFTPNKNKDDDVDPCHHRPTDYGKDGLIRGKRFSYEEDALLKEAIHNYIQANQLGEEGEKMIFDSRKYPQVRRCWFEIAAALPWRPKEAVYKRAQALLSSDGSRHKWIPEEVRTIQAYYQQHGANWKGLAQELGRYRVHVKDAWRRYRLQSRKGKWSQDELQKLYDLVNLDLQMKYFSTKKEADKKKQEYGMLKDNISWYAISNKLATKNHQDCCSYWYNKLSSPMISQGLWTDNDDYRLIDELTKLDACCAEDVDWDNLLEHRAGDICRKRWAEMSRQLSDYKEKSFMQQVDILAGRYCPEMLPFRMETSEE